MFKETGVGETKVFYYRENSAASHLCPEDVTPALLDGVKVLHMTPSGARAAWPCPQPPLLWPRRKALPAA